MLFRSGVTDRLEALRALARKHGGTIAGALERAGAMGEELASLEASGERLERVEGELASAGPRAAALARELSAARADAARRFARAVHAELDALAMARCRVELELPPPDGGVAQDGLLLSSDGAERARILVAPNPGEPLRPLARTASGGELSRVLLAVKRALARVDPVDTYVLDEVDAGIGGSVAEAVGRLLSEVARERQVICVTHLPQVAAFADRHLVVEKRLEGGRTSAAVRELGADERRAEVARMLAGRTVTSSALEHAEALIAGAREAARLPARGRRAAEVRGAAPRAVRRAS